MKKYICLSIACLIMGFIFFLYYKEFLVIKLFLNKPIINYSNNSEYIKINIYFNKNDQWEHIEKNLLTYNCSENLILESIVKSWLNFIADNRHKNIELELAVVESTQAFISFNKNPFNKNSSIKEKIMLIESLLKTIRECKQLQIQSIRFLVHHQPINDSHLYFEKAWPIIGFILN